MAITWLADQLRRDPYLSVIEVGSWKTRTRPGSFSPVGVLLHHTATTSSSSNPAPTQNYVITGSSSLPGPLCHLLVDYNGGVRVIAAGRANHAGTARASGPVPAGDGNTMYVGIEMDYSGSQDPSDDQCSATIDAAAAILVKLGRSASYCRAHKETSTSGKTDPARKYTPDQYRSMIAAWMKHFWGVGKVSDDGMIEAAFSNRSTRAVLDRLHDEIRTNGARNLRSKGYLDGTNF